MMNGLYSNIQQGATGGPDDVAKKLAEMLKGAGFTNIQDAMASILGTIGTARGRRRFGGGLDSGTIGGGVGGVGGGGGAGGIGGVGTTTVSTGA